MIKNITHHTVATLEQAVAVCIPTRTHFYYDSTKQFSVVAFAIHPSSHPFYEPLILTQVASVQ